jgi:hypothetical protein
VVCTDAHSELAVALPQTLVDWPESGDIDLIIHDLTLDVPCVVETARLAVDFDGRRLESARMVHMTSSFRTHPAQLAAISPSAWSSRCSVMAPMVRCRGSLANRCSTTSRHGPRSRAPDCRSHEPTRARRSSLALGDTVVATAGPGGHRGGDHPAGDVAVPSTPASARPSSWSRTACSASTRWRSAARTTPPATCRPFARLARD